MAKVTLSQEHKGIVRAAVKQYKPAKNGLIPWPPHTPQQWNACTTPCDMWTGPCCCGAWHKEGE